MQYISKLPEGAKVKFGAYSVNGEPAQRITWINLGEHIYTPNSGDSSRYCLFVAEHIVDLRAFDGKESGGAGERYLAGNSFYIESNINQWLNSDAPAGQWYTQTGTYDQPPTRTNTSHGTEYDTHPGFLHAFSDPEKAAIVELPIKVTVPDPEKETWGGDLYVEYHTKVYLPATWEMHKRSYDYPDPEWWYFDDDRAEGHDSRATLSAQAYANSLSSSKPESESGYWKYWFRDHFEHSTPNIQVVNDDKYSYTRAYEGNVGVRPVVRLTTYARVSDTVDEDGCYVVIAYDPIKVPTPIGVSSVYEGTPHTIAWSVPTNLLESMGDVVYKVEWAYDGGAFNDSEVVSEASVSRIVESGHNTIRYRVSAAYANDMVFGDPSYSDTMTIINNIPPIISGEDEHLGTKHDGFAYTYSVTDNDALDAGEITVEEAIDGNLIRSYSTEQGVTNTFSVFGDAWLKQSNGSHTMTITAMDNRGVRSIRTLEFVKEVTSLSVETNPMESQSMPVRLLFNVSRKIPDGATYKAEVCNNAFDAEPTWEDATAYSSGDSIYLFENTSKTADSWGVAVRISVDRNDGVGECYITAIGGNFE